MAEYNDTTAKWSLTQDRVICFGLTKINSVNSQIPVRNFQGCRLDLPIVKNVLFLNLHPHQNKNKNTLQSLFICSMQLFHYNCVHISIIIAFHELHNGLTILTTKILLAKRYHILKSSFTSISSDQNNDCLKLFVY